MKTSQWACEIFCSYGKNNWYLKRASNIHVWLIQDTTYTLRNVSLTLSPSLPQSHTYMQLFFKKHCVVHKDWCQIITSKHSQHTSWPESGRYLSVQAWLPSIWNIKEKHTHRRAVKLAPSWPATQFNLHQKWAAVNWCMRNFQGPDTMWHYS